MNNETLIFVFIVIIIFACVGINHTIHKSWENYLSKFENTYFFVGDEGIYEVSTYGDKASQKVHMIMKRETFEDAYAKYIKENN